MTEPVEFKSFSSINHYRKQAMTITEKLHGSNAQLYIEEPDENGYQKIRAGSRNRWLSVGSDNFGFAAWVEKNHDALLALGVGRHYGEWVGPGINNGCGLAEKTLALFELNRYREIPACCRQVAILYQGPYSDEEVDKAMGKLKTWGSQFTPGFMRPEGVVISFMGTRMKRVFDAEVVAWTKPAKGPRTEKPATADYSHLCQPLRLEKLLSRDEAYARGFPATIGAIVAAYYEDLVKEGQIAGDEAEIKGIRKLSSRQVFGFVRDYVLELVAGAQP